MKKYLHDLKIVRKKRLTPYYFVIEATMNDKLPKIKPGQFAEIKIENAKDVFLRRPFSIHDVDYEKNQISFLVQIVGNGTRALSYLEEGDYLNIMYPLGNSFSFPESDDNILLIGGGCGVAPLLYLSRYLSSNNFHPNILVGGRSKLDILEEDEYERYGNLYYSTEDGSFGEKGLVTEHSILQNEKFDKIYTCGPESMMKAVAAIAQEKEIFCEVSLENTMACGIGACLCCVVDTVKGNQCVCTEGPVFNIKDLKW